MSSRVVAMIPARMGSQRLKYKNLQEIEGVPLIVHAIRKAKKSNVFDAIWVNSENVAFQPYAEAEGVCFHQRPEALGNNSATHEQYIYEFLSAHPCEYVFQVHSIAPLLTSSEVSGFVQHMLSSDYDMMVSVVLEQIECCFNDAPINFTFDRKENSQNLNPVQRVTWSITGWRSETFLESVQNGRCATYSGKVGFYPVGRNAGHIIKTEDDLNIARALFPHCHPYALGES